MVEAFLAFLNNGGLNLISDTMTLKVLVDIVNGRFRVELK
jgi:hypothetical protein